MSAQQLIVFMDSMMSVREGTMSSYGKLLPIVLIVFQLLQLLMKRYFVCMAV